MYKIFFVLLKKRRLHEGFLLLIMKAEREGPQINSEGWWKALLFYVDDKRNNSSFTGWIYNSCLFFYSREYSTSCFWCMDLIKLPLGKIGSFKNLYWVETSRLTWENTQNIDLKLIFCSFPYRHDVVVPDCACEHFGEPHLLSLPSQLGVQTLHWPPAPDFQTVTRFSLFWNL